MTRVSQFGERMMRLIESQQWLDIPSYKLEHGYALTLNLLGDSTERVRDLLHGTTKRSSPNALPKPASNDCCAWHCRTWCKTPTIGRGGRNDERSRHRVRRPADR